MFQLPPAPKTQWAVEVLTGDYLIAGAVDADRNKLAVQVAGGVLDDFRIFSACWQPRGILAAPTDLAAPWALDYADSLVALIPRDQASLDYAQKANSSWRYAVPAEVYVGPYRFRGSVLSPDKPLRVFAGYTTGFVAQQVQISSLLPSARLSGLKAPYAGGGPAQTFRAADLERFPVGCMARTANPPYGRSITCLDFATAKSPQVQVNAPTTL
jgi:hypothetical protein